jgi:PAS domain S-box-containing protein
MVTRQALMPRSTAARYGLAVLLAGAAVAARLALEPVWGLKVPLITMFPAIMVSAWLGGFGPGMVTTLLCAVAADYFWLAPPGAFVPAPAELLALVVFVAIGVVTSALNEAWRRSAGAAAASHEQLRITLTSIGDAVIATDATGRITMMNGVAEALTGWRSAAAIGRPLTDVFAVVHEESRHPVDNPVEQVLRDGATVALATHTVLLAKDGREIPIDDSAAPIRTASGEVAGVVMVFRDITEGRRHEQALSRLATIVETSQDAILTKTLDGTITSWNPGAERMFGYAAGEAVGRPIAMLVPPDCAAQEAEFFRRLAAGERVEHFETERIRKDGQRLRVSVSLAPLRDRAGAIVGISTIARDVTEHARLFAAERAARAEAARANRTKDDFLAVLSHELRQPLTTMLGWVRMLRTQALDAVYRDRALEAIERNARAQARMIDDLLDVARIDAGKVTLERRVVDLGVLITETVDSLQQDAKARGLTLETDLDPAGVRLAADADRLRQVLMNLLGNALKYTPPGGQVTVRLAGGETHARVVVCDTGAGIAPEVLPHVFERFRQADAPGGHARGGLGLGLAIVRDIVQLHGGTVEAHSEGRDRGATFVVTLPR